MLIREETWHLCAAYKPRFLRLISGSASNGRRR